MRLGLILSALGRITSFVGVALLAPMFLAWYEGGLDLYPFAAAVIVTLTFSIALIAAFPSHEGDITHKEGILIVAVCWLVVSTFGALPYFFAKVLGPMNYANFVNSLFESVSGFTTTGATIFGTNTLIEDLSRPILLWRSITHWLGGMGIIVLVVAILPVLGVAGMQLFKSEASGPTKEKLRPRIRETATMLWSVYTALTLLEIVSLLLAGMPLFDSVCHAFGTLATGGFSTKNISVEAFHSSKIDIIITIFMFISAANFSLHYLCFTKGPKAYWKNSEFKYYAAITLAGILAVTFVLYFSGTYQSIFSAARYGSFQLVSVMSTTGFTTADFEKWPSAAQMVLLCFMFIGGSVGSTAGAIKIVRVVLVVKYAYRELFRIVHPHSFAAVKLGGKVVSKDILESVAGFTLLYVVIAAAASVIISAFGLDIITSISSVAATLGCVGPGLGDVGPMDNYFSLPLTVKWVHIACMLLGRLELFTLLVLITPHFWKR